MNTNAHNQIQEIIAIAALAKNNVIGNDGKIPWHIKEDFELFKDYTTNQIVVMGRKTWESLPSNFKPLPNRINIVISSSQKEEYPVWAKDIDSAIIYSKLTNLNKKIFLIGGQKIYEQGVEKYANKLYLSHIKKEYEGDTYFPKIDEKNFKVISQKQYNEFTFKIWQRL